MSEREKDDKSQRQDETQQPSKGLEESRAREKARQELAESSWILEVRRKLSDPPPQVLVPKESLEAGSGNGGPASADPSSMLRSPY